MAWVRWSSPLKAGKPETSDLYIYDAVGGVITMHVAGRRRINLQGMPLPPPLSHDNVDEYVRLHHEQMKFLESHNDWEPLPDKWAGQTITFDYDSEALDNMKSVLDEMRQDGVLFPDYIYERIEEVRMEQATN